MNTKVALALLITIISIKTYSQQWVEMMQNPEISFIETQNAFNQYWADKTYERGKGFKQFKRWEYFMQNRVNEQGFFVEKESTYNVYKELKKQESQNKGTKGAGNWVHLGPDGGAEGSGAGRLNCIAFHPTNTNFLIAGAASGGIWISTNGGNNWSTNTDELASLGISDIVFNPINPQIVYAASGDRDAADAYSIGVLKSINGGFSWDTTGLKFILEAKKLVNKLVINPINPDILYAATSGGIYKTYDAGLTWKLIRSGAFKDMAMRPGDTSTLYIATEAVIMRTQNAGSTWSTISVPYVSSNRGVRIGVTAADPNYVYLLTGNTTDAGFGGIYLSTDGGSTFTVRATSPNLLGWKVNGSDAGGQSWYDLALGVSPTNKNTLFVGGVNIWKSTDGGSTWNISAHWTGGSGTPYVHADIHELKYSPHNSSQIWASSDGGAYKATSNGNTWTELNNGLAIGQIYKLGCATNEASKIMTGWQDNGSNIFTNTGWKRELGGDGMECLIDPINSNIMYGSLYYGAISMSTNNGTDWKKITDSVSEKGGWVTPYVLNPKNPKTLIAGYINIWKGYNRGEKWVKISNFSGSATFVTIAVAPTDSNIIYAATSSILYRTINGGSSWTILTGNLGSGNYTQVIVHPNNPLKIWVTRSGFFAGAKVYTSNNGGVTWTNISGNLPNLPANCIVYENGSDDAIYVGMDVGVFYTDSTLTEWIPFIKGLPNVVISELEIYYPTHKLRAATYGRGLWESEVYSLANGIYSGTNQDKEISVYPNPSNSKIRFSADDINAKSGIIYIYNSVGQLIFHQENFSIESYIDISTFSNGLYFINFISENKKFVSKFIKSE